MIQGPLVQILPRYPCFPPTKETELRRCLVTALPTTLQKHAENIAIYLQCFNRRNGKDAAVLGKQVLMFDEKKIWNIRSIVTAMLTPRLQTFYASQLKNLCSKI